MMWRTVLSTVLVLAVAATASANLLTNPGIEDGDLTGWSVWDAGWRASDWGDDVHSGSWGVVDDVTSSDGEWRGIFQLIEVTENLKYEYTAWMRAASVTEGNESFLEVQWFDSSGSQVGSQFQSTHLTADADYALFGSNNIVAPAGAVTANVRAIVHRGASPPDTDWFAFDDFDFHQSIPEPASLALAGFGLLFLLRFRRFSRK